MNRIALLCQHFYPEMISTGMHMTELFTGVAKTGRPIRVYCAPPVYKDDSQQNEIVPPRMTHEGVEIVRVATWGDHRGSVAQRGLFAISFMLSVLLAVLRDRRDLSGIMVTTNPPFIGLVAVFAKWVLSIPYAVIVYDVYPDIAVRLDVFKSGSAVVRLWEQITRLIFRQAKGLIVIGRDMEKIVRAKLRDQSQRIVLIPNWSDERKIRPIPREFNAFAELHYPSGHFVIQYSGRMGRTHNIEPLIEAAALLQDEPVMIQLIGDGAKREKLVALVAQKGLKNVQFLPYQPFEELDLVLTAPDMAMVCLGNEFTGLSVPSKTYGMMAAGRPILAFLAADSEIALTVTENECGVVLPAPTGEQVATLIRQLLAEPLRLQQMSDNGYQAFLKHYSLSSAVIRYERLMRELFDGTAAIPAERTLSGQRQRN